MEFIKGDSIELEVTANTSIADWKIRAEFFDNDGNTVKLATENAGGSTAQISIDNEATGVFTINVAKDLTACFNDQSYIEIEREYNDKKLTIFQSPITMKDQKITWESPSN